MSMTESFRSPSVADAADHRTAIKAEAGALRFSVFRSLAELESDWRVLEARKTCPVHQTYEWCSAWAAAQASKTLVVRVEQERRTVMILPLEIVPAGPIQVARFIASPHNNINFGLFDPSLGQLDPAMFRRSLAEALSAEGIRADCLVLDKMPVEWRGLANPFSGFASVENQNHAFQVTLHERFEDVLAQKNAKRRRKKFRVGDRRLTEAGGYDHVVAESAEEARAMLDTFFAQKAARFHTQGIPDVFADPAIRDFFHTLAGQSGRTDFKALQMHGLRLKGPNAGHFCAISGISVKGDHVICQFGSIDESIVPDASPGETLFYLMIERACQERRALFDFGIGDQPYKRSWCDIETVHRDYLLPLSVAGRVYAAAYRAKVNAKRAIKTNPRLNKIASRIRAMRA